jgi:hypothetical protein
VLAQPDLEVISMKFKFPEITAEPANATWSADFNSMNPVSDCFGKSIRQEDLTQETQETIQRNQEACARGEFVTLDEFEKQRKERKQ